MKKIVIWSVFFVSLFGCSKNNNSPIPPTTIKEYFRGKLNGVAFNDTALGLITSIPNNGIQIAGYHEHGGISLSIIPFSGMIGENLVNQNNTIFIGNNGGFYFAGLVNAQLQGSGKITILELTSSFIRGTFECIAPADSSYSIGSTQIITEGEFKLKKP